MLKSSQKTVIKSVTKEIFNNMTNLALKTHNGNDIESRKAAG